MDWLLTSPPDEVKLIQEIYESTYNKSLKKALEAKCGKKFFLALSALLVPPEEFLAMRLEKAMKGWSADDKVLIRILGGLDHASKPSDGPRRSSGTRSRRRNPSGRRRRHLRLP